MYKQKLILLRMICFFKKIGLKFRFKVLKLSHERMLSGKLFQRSGAETAKALDPQDFRLKLTGFRRNVEDDLRVLDGK